MVAGGWPDGEAGLADIETTVQVQYTPEGWSRAGTRCTVPGSRRFSIFQDTALLVARPNKDGAGSF